MPGMISRVLFTGMYIYCYFCLFIHYNNARNDQPCSVYRYDTVTFVYLFIIIMPGMISRVLFTGMILLLLSIYQLQVIGILKRRFNKLDLDNSQKVFL